MKPYLALKIAQVQSVVHADTNSGLVGAKCTALITRAGIGTEVGVRILVEEVPAGSENTIEHLATAAKHFLGGAAWTSADFTVVPVGTTVGCLEDSELIGCTYCANGDGLHGSTIGER